MKGVYLENLTWPEAERALGEAELILLPLGARCKEHGHHLPLNNDWTIAEYLTRRVLERVPAIALPTVQYGFYPAFIEYPGSVSLRKETFQDLVTEICQSIHAQAKVLGRDPLFYVLNTGISTIGPLEKARLKLSEAGIRMGFLDLRNSHPETLRKMTEQPEGTHADEIETSMMLYIAPESVRMELAKRDIHPELGPGGGLTRDPGARSGTFSPTGAWGDPTLATLEKGRLAAEGMVERALADITGLSGISHK